MKIEIGKAIKCYFLIICFISAPLFVFADNPEFMGANELAELAKGGVLYDKWYKELDLKVSKETHPGYSSAGKKKGSSTWRCKECHGWDYKGKDGAYAKGSHYSGIKGIRGAAGQSKMFVINILKDSTHQYGNLMAAADLRALASFVVSGQMDMKYVIDSNTKAASGNLHNGGRIYQTQCAKCHGADGKKLDFGDNTKKVFIGTVAWANPWEALHKIRFGQPGDDMIGMIATSVTDQVDVLTYIQTLPKQ